MKSTKFSHHFLTTPVEYLFHRKYSLLVLFLLCRYAIYSTNGLWVEDFWEHSAVVRELMTRPLHPMHPQLLLDAKHAFFTPYALLVSATGWLLDFDAISALAVWGLINLFLLSYGLRLFIATVDEARCSSIAFYTLVLILFLWGSDSWQFSGFYSLEGLNTVLPYPSTFALGLSFLGLSLHTDQIKNYALWKQFLLVFICAIVLITHPLTAIFLIIGIGCQSLSNFNKNRTEILKFGITVVITFSIILAWPYFSMLKLMTGEGNVYNFANTPMYLAVLDHIWPSIFLIPVIFTQAIQKKNRSIGLMLLNLIIIYIAGYLTNKYSYGRSIAFILLLSNIFIAQTILSFEIYLSKKPQAWVYYKTIIVLTFLVSMGSWVQQNFHRLLTIGNSLYLGRTVSSQIIYKDLSFISSFTKQSDLILADVEPSWIIPTLGGKVVATDHPLAFVPDWYIRKWQVMEFFNPETNPKRRQEIFETYKPNFLLINKASEPNWKSIFNQFTDENQGLTVFENDKYILLKFD